MTVIVIASASEAIQRSMRPPWIASSLPLLAMTVVSHPRMAICRTVPTLGGHEKNRLPFVRPLDAVAAIESANGGRRARCNRSSLPSPPRSSAPTARIFRVHHYARQLGSPFPLLAACGARTKRIEIGTAVIDMRYENPLYMVEDAGAADIISGGRLQLGISRGSPEQVIDGWRYFGYAPPEGETDADMARRHTEVFLHLLRGEGFAKPNPQPMFPNPPGLLRLEPHAAGLRERIWWGAGQAPPPSGRPRSA